MLEAEGVGEWVSGGSAPQTWVSKEKKDEAKNVMHAVPILQDRKWLRLDTSAGALPRKT